MPDHNYFSSLIWQIADLLRGPYRPPQYERVMLPMTVLRRFDCVLAPKNPMVGSLTDCCARATSGHAAAAPPTSLMNARRLMRLPRPRTTAYHIK